MQGWVAAPGVVTAGAWVAAAAWGAEAGVKEAQAKD